jgi:hypothetical protein
MTTETGTLVFQGPQRELISIDPTASDPTSSKFNFTYDSHQGVNDPGTTRPDTVFSFGYNIGVDGLQENPAEPTLSIHFGNMYYEFGDGGLEFYVRSIDTNGVMHRPLNFWLPRDGGQGSYGVIQADALNLIKYDGTQTIKFDLANNNVTYKGTTSSNFMINNYVTAWQISADGTRYIPMPYIDSNNFYCAPAPVFLEGGLFIGAVNTASAQQMASSNQLAIVTDGNHGSACMAYSQNGIFYMLHSPSTPISST